MCVLATVLSVLLASLSELEHTRDELLMQLYQSEDAFVDKNTVSYSGAIDKSHSQTWVDHIPIPTAWSGTETVFE